MKEEREREEIERGVRRMREYGRIKRRDREKKENKDE